MAKRKRGPFDWLLLDPFGRLGRALGFRWIFPIGTMAIPYHPLIPVVVLATPAIWLVSTLAGAIGGSTGGAQWPWMILAGVLLAIPLSIPILNWAFRAFGALLVQSLLFLAAMVALAADVVTGRAAPVWAVLPAGYVLVYIVQRVGGLLRVRGYRRMIAAYAPVCAGARPLVVQSDDRFFAVDAIRQGLAERAHIAPPSYDGSRIIEPMDQAEVTALEELNHKHLPRSWRIDGSAPHITINRPGELPVGPTVTIATERVGRRIGNGPGMTRWRISAGDEVRNCDRNRPDRRAHPDDRAILPDLDHRRPIPVDRRVHATRHPSDA